MQINSVHYPNCNQQDEETTLHLLWDCNFSQQCWDTLISNRRKGTSIYEESILAAEHLPKQFSTQIIILGCWNSCQQRNGTIFKGVPHTIQSWRFHLKEDLFLLQYKIRDKRSHSFKHWLQNNF
ncbi:hypothetical protein ZWY2020_033994 [Hordeum vulgare]|nr:hypothetical protein ZWY2020_033994 [Hordeum vulgare]